MDTSKKKKEQETEQLANPGIPVEQMIIKGKHPSKKEVKEAVKEINPDQNSLGQRG